MTFYRKGQYGLRVVCEDDLSLLEAHRNNMDTWQHLTSPLPVIRSRQKEWLDSLWKNDFYFIGQVADVDVALLRMTDVDWVNRTAAVGIDIFDSYRGQGFASPLFSLLCSYAFNEINMERLWLLVLEDNVKAKKVYSSVGFKVEGIMRNHIYRNGKRKNYVLMGLLREEFADDPLI